MEIRIRDLIRNTAREVKLHRLKQPYSMLAPKPFHFPQFSKLDKPWLAQPVKAEGLEMDALHDVYGMPRDIPQMFLTMSGTEYGEEFADFTVEVFGLKGETDEPDDVSRLAERTIRDKIKVSNVDPDTIRFGAGGCSSITNNETGECMVKIYVWRWRVYMDNSSLCLENNWFNDDLIGGGWIPYILGIVYDNPEKMVADIHRFAPAFKLCNLVDADLSRPGRPERYKNKEEFLTDLNRAAAQLESDGLALSQPNIAGLMEADERQIRLWCDKFGIKWLAWKQERAAKPDKNGK